MLEKRELTVETYTGVLSDSFAALRTCFDGRRMGAAALGLGVSFVLAAGLGLVAGMLLLNGSLAGATLVAIGAVVVLYAGALVTYGGLAHMAISEGQGTELSPVAALGYSLRRCHIVVGLPMFALVVSVAVASISGWLALQIAAHETLGAALAPVVLVVVFLINLVLTLVVAVSHSLTGPCVACLDPSLAGASVRLTQVARQRLSSFIAAQAAVMAAAVPLLLLTIGLLAAAFLPAFRSVSAGRARAVAAQPGQRDPMPVPMDAPEAFGAADGSPGGEDWVSDLVAGGTMGLAPMIGVSAVVLLLVAAPLLTFASSAQSSVYLALTGDKVPEAVEARASRRAEAAPEKRPPIVHCWRCDAINRFTAERCSKCGARMAVGPSCFATNAAEREE
ncbi:MAG TPA: hypothetical protein QGH10_11250, partial [Armatimonadota bacterium]|nr:hypothetical protein [Armatimonadota bacterium]